jgi:hypothetical protein
MSILESGKWLNFEDVKSSCSIQEGKVKLVLDFLNNFDLIQMKKNKQFFRLHPNMVKLTNRLKEDHSEEAKNQ